MSTEQIWRIESTSLDDTLELAARTGRKLRGGEVIELVSDLGGGKTTFVRGLANGIGSQDNVSSPSFTISNQYRTHELTLNHFDFYRLTEPGIMKNELAEALNNKKSVLVVEWANIVEDILPAKRLTINIKTIGETVREFSFKYPSSLQYLIPIKT